MADKKSFIDMLMPAAIEVSKQTGVDPRIIVAQAAIETGWGKHAPGNNYFGIKSHGKAGGNTLATTEVIDGRPVRVNASFRGYENPAASVLGYGEFITENPRYGPFRAAQGLDAQLSALQASGYATDPNYSRKVGAVARGLPHGAMHRPIEQKPRPLDGDNWQLRGPIDVPVPTNSLAPAQPTQQAQFTSTPPPRGPLIATMGADPYYARYNFLAGA